VIQSAYPKHPPEIAHGIVEQAIQKVSSQSALVLYMDGGPCEEKMATQQAREGETGRHLISHLPK